MLSPSLPTLLIFECVLAYMSPAASNAILKWYTESFSAPLGCVVYEMFALNDPFGRVMVNNLKVSSLFWAFRMSMPLKHPLRRRETSRYPGRSRTRPSSSSRPASCSMAGISPGRLH